MFQYKYTVCNGLTTCHDSNTVQSLLVKEEAKWKGLSLTSWKYFDTGAV